jgi:hypothetical protein
LDGGVPHCFQQRQTPSDEGVRFHHGQAVTEPTGTSLSADPLQDNDGGSDLRPLTAWSDPSWTAQPVAAALEPRKALTAREFPSLTDPALHPCHQDGRSAVPSAAAENP